MNIHLYIGMGGMTQQQQAAQSVQPQQARPVVVWSGIMELTEMVS